MKQSQFVASPRANIGGNAGSSDVRSSKKDASGFVVVEAREKDWNLNGMITASEASESDFREKFCDTQIECWVVHTKMLADLLEVARMARRIITLKEQWNESYREFPRTQSKLKVPKTAVLEAQNLSC